MLNLLATCLTFYLLHRTVGWNTASMAAKIMLTVMLTVILTVMLTVLFTVMCRPKYFGQYHKGCLRNKF